MLVRDVVALVRAERSAPTEQRRPIASVRRDLEGIVGPAVVPATAARLLGVSPTALAKWARTGDVATVETDLGRDLVPLAFLVGLLEEVEAARASRRRPLSFVLRRRAERAAREVDLDALLPEVAGTDRADRFGHRPAELRSLALHRMIAGRLDDRLVDEARYRVERIRQSRAIHPRVADTWDRLLARPVEEMARKLGEDSLEMRDLRQATPVHQRPERARAEGRDRGFGRCSPREIAELATSDSGPATARIRSSDDRQSRNMRAEVVEGDGSACRHQRPIGPTSR